MRHEFSKYFARQLQNNGQILVNFYIFSSKSNRKHIQMCSPEKIEGWAIMLAYIEQFRNFPYSFLGSAQKLLFTAFLCIPAQGSTLTKMHKGKCRCSIHRKKKSEFSALIPRAVIRKFIRDEHSTQCVQERSTCMLLGTPAKPHIGLQ